LYNVQVVNLMVLMVLSSIAVEQITAIEQTMEKCTQLLDYLSNQMDAKICFHASDIIMNIHSNFSYLLEANAQIGHVDISSWGGCLKTMSP
jgi:hypothetical protein